MLLLRVAILACGLLLAQCSYFGPGGNQELTCRQTLPVLGPEDAALRVNRVETDASGREITIRYEARLPDGAQSSSFVRCLFASDARVRGATNLVGIETRDGALSDAKFFFLKRVWLGTSDAALATPAPAPAAAMFGEWNLAATHALQQAIGALPRLGFYGLTAIAFALIYGLIGKIFLAFGEIVVIGGATAGSVVLAGIGYGFDQGAVLFAAGLLVAVGLCLMIGRLAAKLLSPVLRAQNGQAAVIASIGLALVLVEGLRLLKSNQDRFLPGADTGTIALASAGDYVATASLRGLTVAALCFCAAGALAVAMRFSRFGLAWRATAQDALAAALCGIDDRRMLVASLALGGALAGFVGSLMTIHYGGIGFADGATIGLKALIGAIVGGIGSVGAAFAGGIAVAAFESLWMATMPIAYADVAIFSLLAVVIVLRPPGDEPGPRLRESGP